jgi:hypothetical protein
MIGTPRTREAAAIIDRIRPLLAGHSPEVQGAVIADLTAIWLAGHHVAGDEDATRKMRDALLVYHCAEILKLTRLNARILGTTP